MHRTIYRVRHPKARNRLPFSVTLYSGRTGGLYSHNVVLHMGDKTRAELNGTGNSIREAFARLREQLAMIQRFTIGRNFHT